MAREISQAVRQLASRMGVRLGLRKRRASFSWDGRSIYAFGRSDSDVIHDLAHLQCSEPHRRLLPEWGLGSDPGRVREAGYDAPRVGVIVDADEEESAASLLGILWERELGLDYMATFYLHGWTASAGTVDAVLRKDAAATRLRRWRLIRRNRPLVAFRPESVKEPSDA